MEDFIYQTNENECGFACLKMLLSHLYKDSKYLYLPHNDKKDQYSLFELKEIAKNNGAIITGYLVNDLGQLPKNKEFIMIYKNQNGGKHAILIKKRYNSFSYVYDPAIGKKLINNKKIFTSLGESVEILTVNSFSPTANDFLIEPLISNKDKNTILLLEGLAILCYFFTAYFVDSSFHFLYPILLVVAGVLFAIIYRTYNFKVMQKFDDSFIRYTYDSNLIVREANYRLMHKTKSGLLSTMSNFVLTLFSALAVNAVLILSNYISSFVLISSSLLVLLDLSIFTPKIKKENIELEKLENELLNDKDISKEEYETCYSEIKELTYRIARKFELKRIIFLFALLIVTFFMSAMTNNANIYYILLYFAMCVFTYTSLNNAAEMYSKNKENKINEVKFYDLMNKNKE